MWRYLTITDYTDYSLPPYFRWDGFRDEADIRDQPEGIGIGGGWGQFLAIWYSHMTLPIMLQMTRLITSSNYVRTSVIYAMFACMGGDIVIVTAGEAKKPHLDLPRAACFMYLVPITFYILLSFVLGFNINYFNPDLFHTWARDDRNISHSPFIIVMKYTSIKVLPGFLNGCFLFAAYTAA
jgi:yeast amino acid transporter